MSEASIERGELLAAKTTLTKLTEVMAEDCQKNMNGWPRDWMQKHINDRAAIIKVSQILIDLAEVTTRKP